MAGNRVFNKTLSTSLALALFLCALLRAQPTNGTQSGGDGGRRVEGHVRDASGLPVPRASVVLRNALTGAARTALTGDSGQYAFGDAGEGRYSLTFSAPGLASETRLLELRTGRVQVIDVELGLARVNQEVTVVSGSRMVELQADSPVKVEAVTREEIRDTGYERVSDVLAEIPGVLVRSGSTGTVGAQQIQGIDSRQVLVLQDGLPVVGARGIKSGTVNLDRQNVGKLDRVEVAKGAASALYGSDAIGGVINMITMEPSEPFTLGAVLSGGSLGAVDGRLNLGARWKKLTVFTDLESHRQDSYSLIPGNPGTVGPDFRRNDILTKLRYSFSERAAIGVSATAYHNHQTGLANSSVGLTLGTSNDSNQMYALTGDFVLTPATTLQTRAYTARYDENSKTDLVGTNTPSYGFANLNERYHRLDATLSHQLGHKQLIQSGFEWAQDLYRGANRLVGDNTGQQVTTNDVWLQDRIQPFDKLTLTLGGRYQNHSLYGDHLVPKVGIVYRVAEHWIARGSFGKGFRAPDLGQLYYRFANPSSFYQVIGNPTLRPENSASYSAGLTYLRRRAQLGLSLYRNTLNNLIDAYSVGTPQTAEELAALLAPYGVPLSFNPLLNRLTYIYLNLNRARTQGVELNGNVAVTRQVRLWGAYTFLNAVDRSTGLGLPQRHRHQGYVKADYSNPRWGLLVNVRGTFFSQWLLNPAQGTYGSPYRIWDTYASKRLPHGFQAFLAIDNLAGSRDRKLTLPTPTFDRPDYGRTCRVGLRWRLGRE